MLIIISGLPGTGKTTFARLLAQHLEAVHLNSDIIREELNRRGRYDDETKALIYRRMKKRTEEQLQRGATVIVDATFYKRSFRTPYYQLAARYRQPLKWIEMEAEESIIRERVATRRAYSEADFYVYQKIKKAYEPLAIPHLVLSSDAQSTQALLLEAMRYLE